MQMLDLTLLSSEDLITGNFETQCKTFQDYNITQFVFIKSFGALYGTVFIIF